MKNDGRTRQVLRRRVDAQFGAERTNVPRTDHLVARDLVGDRAGDCVGDHGRRSCISS